MWFSTYCFEKNYFTLSKKISQQQLETAISTKFSPLYTNRFTAVSEECIFEYPGYHQYPWLRFLNNILFTWRESLKKLQKLFTFRKIFHPRIKFTAIKPKIYSMPKYSKGTWHLKLTCTVNTQRDISKLKKRRLTIKSL